VRSVAERGVSLIATAHGTDLSSLLTNPVLRPLLGGVQAVVVSDKAAAAAQGDLGRRPSKGNLSEGFP
jgi:stage III sporulation protein SpoIIIAA